MKKMYELTGPLFEIVREVHKIVSRTGMWDVACDRMVIAINSNLCN